ncbi:hypothetical protein QE152_g5245 [Popillia japonica]|uniref:Uncharacterized protein n=1 Tax=Popillia japonica TaxID=7064 RepID=A0AAW1MRG7_POPJA
MRKDPFHPRKIHYQPKRKRIENSPENQRLTSQGVPATDLQSILRRICGQIEALENMVSDTYKPKKELAQIKLTTQKPENYEEKQEANEPICEECKNAKIQHLRGKRLIGDGTWNEPICEECKNAKIQHLRGKRLIGDGTWNSFKQIKEEEWGGTSYLCQTLSASKYGRSQKIDDCDVVLPCNRTIASTKKSTHKAIEYFGGRRGLVKQRKIKGQVAKMLHTTSFPEENETTAEQRRSVKSTINPSEIGVEIAELKRTRKGDLLLTVRNGLDKAQIMKRELNEKMPEINTTMLKKTKVIHLKDMDETTEENEIKEAISKALQVNQDCFEVKALRSAYGNTRNATVIIDEKNAEDCFEVKALRSAYGNTRNATVIIDEKNADRLVNMAKIGWIKCRVIERKQDTKQVPGDRKEARHQVFPMLGIWTPKRPMQRARPRN